VSAEVKQTEYGHVESWDRWTDRRDGGSRCGINSTRLSVAQPWAAQTGQNFTVNHLLPYIDFAAIHVWPDNWERCVVTDGQTDARVRPLGGLTTRQQCTRTCIPSHKHKDHLEKHVRLCL
jgi:hypothetical protein